MAKQRQVCSLSFSFSLFFSFSVEAERESKERKKNCFFDDADADGENKGKKKLFHYFSFPLSPALLSGRSCRGSPSPSSGEKSILFSRPPEKMMSQSKEQVAVDGEDGKNSSPASLFFFFFSPLRFSFGRRVFSHDLRPSLASRFL